MAHAGVECAGGLSERLGGSAKAVRKATLYGTIASWCLVLPALAGTALVAVNPHLLGGAPLEPSVAEKALNDALAREDALAAERQALIAERDRLQAQLSALAAERDALQGERNWLRGDLELLDSMVAAEREALLNARDGLRADLAARDGTLAAERAANGEMMAMLADRSAALLGTIEAGLATTGLDLTRLVAQLGGRPDPVQPQMAVATAQMPLPAPLPAEKPSALGYLARRAEELGDRIAPVLGMPVRFVTSLPSQSTGLMGAMQAGLVGTGLDVERLVAGLIGGVDEETMAVAGAVAPEAGKAIPATPEPETAAAEDVLELALLLPEPFEFATDFADELDGLQLAESGIGGPVAPLPTAVPAVTIALAPVPAMPETLQPPPQLADLARRAEELDTLIRTLPLASPVDFGARVTSRFGGRRDPITRQWVGHSGVDMAGPRGNAVYATAAGTVAFAGWRRGYGNMVEIDHGLGIKSRYAHLQSISVEEGDIAVVGEQVGLLGSTGRTTGPHLHYEVLVGGRPVDPAGFMRAGYDVLKAVGEGP